MRLGALEGELLPRWIALPIFASDPLSSVAYATEAGLIVLVASSVAVRGLIVPIAVVIAALLAVVVLSYRQTTFAYPNGGGSYVVAKVRISARSPVSSQPPDVDRLRVDCGRLDRLRGARGHLCRARARVSRGRDQGRSSPRAPSPACSRPRCRQGATTPPSSHRPDGS